eukprot:jgi/Hompol1/3420/HPOL_006525-RA
MIIISKLVRHALARVISEIAKIELLAGSWLDLIPTLISLHSSAIADHRDIGLYIIYTLFEVIADDLSSQLPGVLSMLTTSVNDPESLTAAVTSVQILGKIADTVDEKNSDTFKVVHDLIPNMAQVLQRALNASDDESALKVFEVFEGILMIVVLQELPFYTKHFADLIGLYLSIAQNTAHSDQVRTTALAFIMLATVYCKTRIQKLGLISRIIDSIFPIAAEDEPDDRDEEYPAKLALQVISSLGKAFPPQHVLPAVMQHAAGFLQRSEPGFRRAAMLALAVMVEGCADYMRPRIREILPLVINSMQDVDGSVRRSACTALASLSQELDDELSEQHAVIVPLLVRLSDDPDPDVQSVVIATLESFIDLLEDEVEGYIHPILSKLMQVLSSQNRKAALAATSCIGAVALSAGS